MVRWLYSLLFIIGLPLILLRLWWRSRSNPGYAERLAERFGIFKAPARRQVIWVHAVSVGEVVAATPVIRRLMLSYPNHLFVVTTMTPTGSDQVRKNFRDELGRQAFHVYVPYDDPLAVQRFMVKLQPRILLIMETELWPNMIHYCARRHCPVIVVNARLSERSAKGYRRFLFAARQMLGQISLILAQHQNDAERFMSLGIPYDRIQVTGSVKFDLEIDEARLKRALQLRSRLEADRSLWIAASTHAGEDEIVLQAHRQVLATLPNAILLLVPRHPERFDAVHETVKQAGLSVARRSQHEVITADDQVFLVDSMGELMDFYGTADLAFVGGSLVANGGHNPLEPAAFGMPVLMGPHVFNFEAICQQLENRGGLGIVKSADELAREVVKLLQGREKCHLMGQQAKAEVDANRGAVERVCRAVIEQLELSP